MKTKTWPDDAGVPETDDWLHMNDWLAELRDEEPAEAPGDPRPEAVAAAPVNRPAARAQTTAHAETTVRAVIGDQLRMPTAWCELGTCISRHTHPGALGEADIRARAIGAGWCIDALGRLACPRCQQAAPEFRSPLPVALWDRDKAITSAARVTATAAEISHDLRRPASGYHPASPWESGRHRERPAVKTMPASTREPGRHRNRPAAKAAQ
jgi:hypothetical protein